MRVFPGGGAELTKLNPPIVLWLHGVMKDHCYPGCNLNFLLEIRKLLKQSDTVVHESFSIYIFLNAYMYILKSCFCKKGTTLE